MGGSRGRRTRRLEWLGLLCGLALVALLSAGVTAASAAEPPSLVSLSLTPSTVNTKSSSQTVTVTAEITSGPGFANGSVAFESPTGEQTSGKVSLTKASGSANKGVWEAAVPFKQYMASGSWRISSLNLGDKEGNQTRLSSTQLETKGFAHTVLVESTEDNEPPVLAGVSIAPTSVNTTSSSQTVAVTAHITDNLSGLASGSVAFKSPNGKQTSGKVSFAKVSGTEANGTYEAKVTFHQFIAPGTWKISAIALTDNAGNEVLLASTRLEAKGLPDTVHVESLEDEEPPVLAGLSITPSSVDTSSSSQAVTLAAHITDDLSGFATGSVVLESPNGKQTTGKAVFTKSSGTSTDGTYEATVTFERFIQSGTWKVKSVNLVNEVGNEANLSDAQLEAKGFPHAVQVESVEDTEPPALAALSITPSTLDTTSSDQTATLTAEVTDGQAGFAHGTVVFESPSGKKLTGVASFTKVSGTDAKGTYEAKVTFKRFIQSGTWKVSKMSLVDGVGNEVELAAAQLETKAFPATVTVEGEEDLQAPALTGLSIVPTTIDTASSSQTVTVLAHITENLSGFATGSIVFESQTGKQFTGKASFVNKLSGTRTDGTYEGLVTFKQSAESGTWKVNAVTLLDVAGNEASLGAVQLEAKGLPDTVLDETGAPPTVKKISPRKGASAGGTLVSITGTNFTAAGGVKFGSKEASGFTVNSVNSITATSPAGTTGTVDVTVTTPNGTSPLSSRDRFQYGAPTVTGLSPNSGPRAGATSVTITGTGFELGSGTVFKFGAATASSVNCASRTSCTAVSPAVPKAGSVDVVAIVVSKHSGKNALDRFTYS